MHLVRLIYTSTISDDFSRDDIESILATARKHNPANHLTGMLCFGRKIFLQCLEGSREAVNETYHRICNDTRHHSIILLDYKEIIEREFTSWDMGYAPESSLTSDTHLKYSPDPYFNPYEMSGESAYRLLMSLKDIIPTISE